MFLPKNYAFVAQIVAKSSSKGLSWHKSDGSKVAILTISRASLPPFMAAVSRLCLHAARSVCR